MLKRILLIAAGLLAVLMVLVIGLFGYAATLPAEFHVERSTTIARPPEVVFDHVNDFHRWDAWSPWSKLDPEAKIEFAGPPAGEGAEFRWAGNDQIGVGSMKIVESQPSQQVRIKLEFIKPFPDVADVRFTLQPVAEGTTITWSMDGKHPSWVSKTMCLVMNMEGMIGGSYEEGLANLKRVVETPPAESEPAANSTPAP
ncbi:MAG: SRPBCC family protein [Pirellulaceae bacterium]|nr:SRPBCC family protein [Pirellulaceae bacterium]